IIRVPLNPSSPVEEQTVESLAQPETVDSTMTGNFTTNMATLALRLMALLLTWAGNATIVATSLSSGGRLSVQGMTLAFIGVVLWLGGDIFDAYHKRVMPMTTASPTIERYGLHPVRLVFLFFGGVLVVLTLLLSRGNEFSVLGILTWVMSVLVVGALLLPDEVLFSRGGRAWHVSWRQPTVWVLLGIMLVGAFFRLYQLDATPSQMTSDHVEKLLDAQRVLNGHWQIFFPNNGGREPLQMYLMAAFSQIPGLGMNFFSLKLLSAIEGIIILPMIWWMTRAIFGERDRSLRDIVAICATGLVAVSLWHVELSRLALRIVLTTGVTAVLFGWLSHAYRTNRRVPYLVSGVILGIGLYMYQAVRMLPVVVLVGVAFAMLGGGRNRQQIMRYIYNLMALVIISAVVFIPLFVFSLENPSLFWLRTSGRLLGDSVIQEIDVNGNIVGRNATLNERLNAFLANVPILRQNIINVLKMFNLKGDVAWINHASNFPHLDALTGALLLLGIASWVGYAIRRRDTVIWLVPISAFIMLLPSALSIAYPIENPSTTRTSGALPFIYVMMAFPLGVMVHALMQTTARKWLQRTIATVLIGGVMLVSFLSNSRTYFVDYHNNYLLSSLPYRQGGEHLAAFNQQVGGIGNSFMIAYPYWWDHRALGFEAGIVNWQNGIVTLTDVPAFLETAMRRTDEYHLNVEQDLLFFYSVEDVATRDQLSAWFSEGEHHEITIQEQNRKYAMFQVPALGQARFDRFLQQTSRVATE
ncbi:MAG: ArnT family glycosyltransferase, partial [Phototrophicaceae bacterium]